jgi:hypothetical protein
MGGAMPVFLLYFHGMVRAGTALLSKFVQAVAVLAATENASS